MGDDVNVTIGLTLGNDTNATFEQWAKMLEQIYGSRNEKRTLPEMWLRAVSDASKVGEAIRKVEPYEAMLNMTHTFGWVITVCNRLLKTHYGNLAAVLSPEMTPLDNLTSVILSKYPSICPYCGGDQCICASMRRTVERESKSERRKRLIKVRQEHEREGKLPVTIAEISDMFARIYGETHYGTTIERITFHFLEEVGEVAWCMTSLEDGQKQHLINSGDLNMQLAEEIADVVGWGFAVIAKLASLARQSIRMTSIFLINKGIQTESVDYRDEFILPSWLWYLFYDPTLSEIICHTCKKSPCEC